MKASEDSAIFEFKTLLISWLIFTFSPLPPFFFFTIAALPQRGHTQIYLKNYSPAVKTNMKASEDWSQ